MIVSGFHSRNDDWVLLHKLRVLSQFCDAIVVLLDRSPQSELICRQFPKVQVHHWQNTRGLPDVSGRGNVCEEGAMRQASWDLAAKLDPQYVILGDSDEIPAPAIVEFLAGQPAAAELWYADWINLIYSTATAIGGDSVWSWQRKDTNKKGMVVRYQKGKEYRYDTRMIRHCRMEPNTLSATRAIFDPQHRLGPVPLVHYKWANWRRWQQSAESQVAEFGNFPWDASIVPVPEEYLWRWSAEEMVLKMKEPIAVIGNGPLDQIQNPKSEIRNFGAEIDAHPTIIRMNNWKVEGFEDQVGRRTTHWCVNCWDDIAPRDWPFPMFTTYSRAEQRERIDRFTGMYPHLAVTGKSWTDPARSLKREKPSNGLVLLHHLARMGKWVNAYGFAGMRGGHYWDPGHKNDHTEETTALRELARMGVKFHGRA